MATTNGIEKREGQVVEAEWTRGGPTFQPNFYIIERPDELLLVADVPGAGANDIDINYDRGDLTLFARVSPRQDEDTAFLLREYGVGDYQRTFRVGENIDAGRIGADVHNGVLTLHLPKTDAAKPHKIQVRTA